MFPTIGFLARQILGVIGSQIEIERIFSLAGILTNLRRMLFANLKFKKVDICQQKLAQ
jgi:hypothetical protein